MTQITREELMLLLADHYVEILAVWEEQHGQLTLAQAALEWQRRQRQENPTTKS